jgi:uncharacterized protein YkwD
MIGHLRTPAVLAAAIAIALPATADAARSRRAKCANANLVPSQTNLDRVRRATLCLVNRQRAAHRRSPLTISPDLAQAANAYVNAMAARGFFSHVSPEGSTPVSRIKVTLYLVDARSWAIGENLAWGGGRLATPRQMVVAWMGSPSHRHNMLSSRYRQLGVGIALGTPERPAGRGATYATEFGVRVTARAASTSRRR